MKKIGYVAAIIEPETIKKLITWSEKVIPNDVLLTSRVNGKIEGGNVLDNAHLTLFFGLDDNLIDRHAINEFIKSMHLYELKISGIGAFLIPKMKCKILYFSINDNNHSLQNMHEEFLKFPHYVEDLKPFTPHITIAYVKDSFDEKKLKYNGSKKLPIKEIKYLKYR